MSECKPFHALVLCRSGLGTSALLKVKVDQVIAEHHWPITTEHGSLQSLMYFDGDLAITMSDLKHDLENKVACVIGIDNIIDKDEIAGKLKNYLESKGLFKTES